MFFVGDALIAMTIFIIAIAVALIIELLKIILKPSAEDIGRNGEAYVARLLRKLPEEYVVINDILLRDNEHTSQIDHVVVSPYGIFVIETKNISGKIYGTDDSERWEMYLGHEEHEFRNPNRQNYGHIVALSKHLNMPRDMFVSIVTFVGNTDLRICTSNIVVYGKYLRKTIRSFTNVCLTDSQIEYISRELSLYTNYSRDDAEAHKFAIREKQTFNKSCIQSGICPKCGGKLVLRTGPYSSFWGCNNYPNCKFTISV